MNDRNFDNFSHNFNKWQKNIINFTIKRNLANKELEKYIKSVPTIDSEIYRALFTAKEYYTHKLRYYNRKNKRLKKKEHEFKQLLVYAKKKGELFNQFIHELNVLVRFDDELKAHARTNVSEPRKLKGRSYSSHTLEYP